MPNYRQIHAPGGTYFFTVVTCDRMPILSSEPNIELLKKITRETQRNHPFDQIAYCILPDHIHCIWTLPVSDKDYCTRWMLIKARFSREYKPGSDVEEHISDSRARKRERDVWQRRFWEHAIRNDEDLSKHIDYIHFNPIKHGVVKRLSDWKWSSFHEFIDGGYYDKNWGVEEPIDLQKLRRWSEV